jgi:perosamine synthetase
MKVESCTVRYDQSEADQLERLLHGTRTSGTSETVREYEERLARCFGARFAVAFSSGTAAIHGAMAAVGVGPGDEVVVPASAPVMTGLPVLFQNARPVFCDVQPGRFDLDLQDLERKIGPRTRAVTCVPMWGYPQDVRAVARLCERRGVPLIEDIAQATGATFDGRRLGTFGAIGCASTHERKLICTGEGGFTITDDAALAGRMREFQRYGMSSVLGRTEDSGRDGGGQSLGWNYKLNAVTAAVGISQVAKLEAKIQTRTGNARRIADALAGLPGVRVYAPPAGGRANYYALVVHIDATDGKPGRTAVDFARSLAAEGVVSDTLEYDYRPLYEYPLFQGEAGYGTTDCPFSCPRHRSPYRTDRCPNMEALATSIVTLPTHEALGENEIVYIGEAFRRVHASYGRNG